jgi:flagellar biosynthesis protein FlhG
MSVSQVDQLAAWAARATATSGGSSAPAALVSEPAAGRTVAVASGKGGVGKTTIAVNLAWLIARQGPRVLFIDADFGCANAQCYWPAVQGAPERTLGDVFAGR